MRFRRETTADSAQICGYSLGWWLTHVPLRRLRHGLGGLEEEHDVPDLLAREANDVNHSDTLIVASADPNVSGADRSVGRGKVISNFKVHRASRIYASISVCV